MTNIAAIVSGAFAGTLLGCFIGDHLDGTASKLLVGLPSLAIGLYLLYVVMNRSGGGSL